MKCQRCQSDRIVHASGKCDDRFNGTFRNDDFPSGKGVPRNIGIGGGDYLTFDFCLQCGQMQGKFPITNDPETIEVEGGET